MVIQSEGKDIASMLRQEGSGLGGGENEPGFQYSYRLRQAIPGNVPASKPLLLPAYILRMSGVTILYCQRAGAAAE